MLGPYLVLFNETTKIPLPYQLVYYLIPGAKALRVPARFAQFFLLCITIIGSFGVVAYFQWSRRWPLIFRAVPVFVFALLLIFDYGLRPNNGVNAETKRKLPAAYKYLKQSKSSAPVLELPIGPLGPATPWYAFKYQLYQTEHWRPLIGGMSGWFPPAS